ncbi:MAG: TonB-dependent receptor plug domain-containing protein [Chitinivibrionales bacterium]|nr:TonB-dependent receptor plug domain-containing protein [Chitinivibrionales bacterium]MBD3394446.1 TonB-dependent receptor plug domain-containing protein [Chitinivibrionales bacterium]
MIIPARSCIFPAVLCAAVAVPPACLAGAVVGTVRSAQSEKPLAGVNVRIEETGGEASTNGEGAYAFDSLNPGTYTFLFTKPGFESQTRNDVYVAGEGRKRVDADMLPQVLQLEKMVVTGTAFRKAPDMATSTKVMNFDEILRAPGALVDVQRVVQNLPSVASGGDNVNEVVVRGGTPGENLLIMDNIEIPNPNHFAQQGSGGGVVSLINPLLVKGLTFNAGAPPAQYGGKASSVVDVELRDGNDKIVLGGIDLGLSGAGGHIEGPLWPQATFMASGHRSYLDLIARFPAVVAIPEFWGFQAKLSQRIGSQKLSANGIYGRNSITIDDAKDDLGLDHDIVKSGGDIYVGGMSWKAYWGDYFSTLVVASGTGNTFDRLTYDPAPGDTGFTNASSEQEQTLKAQCAVDFDNSNRVLLGAYGRRCDFNIDMREQPDTIKAYHRDPGTGAVEFDSVVTDAGGEPLVLFERTARREVACKYGGFVSSIVHLFERLRVVPGVRVDGFDYNASLHVSPRLSAVYALTPSLDVNAAVGVQYQDPDYSDLVRHPANRDLEPKRAITGIGGVEQTFDALDAKISLEGYYKRYDDLPVSASLLAPDTGLAGRFAESTRLVSTGDGHSFGVELFAQKKLARNLFGTFAYSFSRSLYEDPRPGHEGEWYDGDYDFRHGLTATGGWKLELLGRDWYARLRDRLWFKILSPVMPVADRMEFSAKWRYLGGRPYTRHVYDDTYRRWYVDRTGELNAKRHDPYHRLDIRFERRYGFGFLHMIYYFDLQNIYNRENVWQFVYPDGRDEPQPIYQFPFFPVGGIIIGF